VYNGEAYLKSCLDALLEQTFKDFEVILVDNASTDGTVKIAREYAAHDSRVRVYVNDSNIGAAPNFNRAFDLSRGKYFKWAAHDDLMEPEFLARCVSGLDEDQSVVLAHPRAMIIDGQGEEVEPYDLKLPTDSEDPVERYASLLQGHKCFEIFGLIRREELAKTPGMGAYSHGDGILLARLALSGRFFEIPEYSFRARRHEKQSMAMLGNYHQYAIWFNPRLKNKWIFPHWRILWELYRSISWAPINAAQKRRCRRILWGWILMRRNLLWGDVTYHVRRLVKKWTGLEIPGRATRKSS
jgi:glycosyltransferase involved in cell wall biosynthesis